MKGDKKIIFSEKIDSIINGIALGLAFIIFAFLIYFFDIFHNVILDRILAVVSAMVGILFTSFEIDKIDKDKMYGFGDCVLGMIFIIPAISVILYFKSLFLNIVMSGLLILGTYGSSRGLLEIIYSVSGQEKSGYKKFDIIKILTFFTEFIALVVVVIQLMTEIIKIRT